MTKKKALGRGLSAIFNDQTHAIEESVPQTSNYANDSIHTIPLDLIDVNPSQPRTYFDASKLEELSRSIQALGLIQPITVRAVGTRYQLIAGERRYRASQLAGIKELPAYIRFVNDQQILELALVENIQRQDLNAIEIAYAYQRLIEECNLSHEDLSTRVGKDRTTIVNYLRLLKLPPEVQKAVIEEQISMGHARAIVNIEDESLQQQLFQQILKEELSVRSTETAVKTLKANQKKGTNNLPRSFKSYETSLNTFFEAKVKLKVDAKGKGAIAIPFKSEEDLKRILEKLEA